MNADQFEKQLECQSLRTPPAAWRGEILAAARASNRASAQPADEAFFAGWRAFLSRLPLAWGAVAALWAFILGANLLLTGPAFVTTAGNSGSVSREPMALWSLQRAELSLLAEQLSGPPPLAPRPPAATPAPRSDRRREEGWGELESQHALSRIV